MSELLPSLVPLDKGLNLQTAKLVAPAGSVLDTLNYEQVDFQGQKRIDGFVRYDGSASSAVNEYYVIVFEDASAYSTGDVVTDEDGSLVGIVVASSGSTISVVILDDNLIPEVGDSLFRNVDGTDGSANVVVTVTAGKDVTGITVDQHYNNLLAYSEVLRNLVTDLPGQVIGLHWFRDRLYAVADVTTISIDGTTPVIYPNDILVLDGFPGVELKVLDAYEREQTRLVFLGRQDNGYDFDAWQVEGTEVTRDGVHVGFIANGFETVLVGEEIASFFESRTEAQAEEEDGNPYHYGWRFVDLGWLINFEDGLSLFGSLPSLNQNITGLGVQGPTTVGGDNGAPLILTQKVNLTNGEEQVNGWKSSQTPTTYELETDNLLDIDDDTIYADAYVSWDGTTTEVVGITDPLLEYPATNTVEVEIP